MASVAAPPVTAQAKPPLRLLSLDGGGVRGLSELIILDELMLKIQKHKALPTPPKPCDIFDLICGTSTGGIVALLLGRLRLTVKEAIDIYCHVSNEVFGKPKAKGHFSEGKFQATGLEGVMKRTIEKFGEPKHRNGKADPEMKLSGVQAATKECRVFVCCRSARAMDTPRLFRSYPTYSAGEYPEMTIWQAARATSAAPTFFKRLRIGPPNAQEELLDGGIGSNNPTKLMMREAYKTFEETRGVACVISIGTGVMDLSEFKPPSLGQKIIPKELIDVLKEMVTDCQEVEKELSRFFTNTSGVYFRFNVERGLEDIKLEDAKELGNMKTKTIRYLEQDGTARSVAEAVSVLCDPTAKIPLSDLSMERPLRPAKSMIHPGTRTDCSSDNLPQDQSSRDCLKSLGFPGMGDRSNDIESAAPGTCEWLLRHEIYKSWAVCEQGLLWIKGKPGSGKSTLLRHALDNVQKVPTFRDEDLVLSFFFHGRGNELQKNPLGLFRSLLHQILSKVPEALPDLVAKFQNWHYNIRNSKEECYEWHLSELQRFFASSLSKILQSRPIWLFMDALDECGEENAVSIYRDFKSRLKTRSLESLRFHICFTCRHYPILDTGNASEISLEHENKQDISTYVRDLLSESPILTTSGIPDLVTNRANGVFMWARLVVEHILKLERSRRGLQVIENKIYDTPPDLSKLFNEIIRSVDEKAASLRMIQWICFATRPLTLDELRWAMIVDPDCSPDRRQLSLKDCESMEEYIGDSARMEGRVIALSCGLAEIVESSKKRVVQFIHQSVQDFFLEEGLSSLHDSLAVADNNLESSIVGSAHYKLSRACVRYMFTEEIAQSAKDGIGDRSSHRAGMLARFPLSQYAVKSWLVHVKQSEARKVSQEDLLSYFDWPSENLVRQWLRVQAILDPKGVFVPLDSRLAHVMSRYDLIEPLRIMLQRTDQVGVDINAKNMYGETPLSYAANYGYEAIVKLLVEEDNVEADSKNIYGTTPLSLAASCGYKSIVKLLLQRERVEADSKNRYGRTPLSYAAENGHEAIVKLLVERDVEADSKDGGGRTPLSYAANNGAQAIVELLIKRDDVDVDSPDYYGRSPLSYAAIHGAQAIVELLIKRDDVDADSKDEDGRTPLSYATEQGNEAVVKLLLQREDIEVDSKDEEDRTPLSYATKKGNNAVIKLLLEREDVEVDSKDKDDWTPLFYAVARGNKAVVRLLLQRDDVEVGSKDKEGRTPLSYAIVKGRKDIVKLLVEREKVSMERHH